MLNCIQTKWTIVALALVFSHCGQQLDPQAKLAKMQPNVSSELAVAMRAMDGELVSLIARHAREDDWGGAALTQFDLTQLMPTDSSMLVDGYSAFSIAFSKQIDAFNAAPSADTYSGVVSGCLSCHMHACPGPLARINKRRLDGH
ncbi:MAG TPA: hypothetical protein DD635_05950 [Flavobacteriales bacterium]|nr:hypothetical protein [Flavobacteriales bacterium]|tara:strand:- start:4687 stop:5121 length:435 start_codon:yes stop_codon:yes gene_type:complete